MFRISYRPSGGLQNSSPDIRMLIKLTLEAFSVALKSLFSSGDLNLTYRLVDAMTCSAWFNA
jgi:hypothetical protein